MIRCRFCGSDQGALVLDAGLQPASDLFPPASDPGPDELHPLRMWMCAGCSLAQLVEDPTVPEEPRGQEPEALLRQAADAVDSLAAAGLLTSGSRVLEYTSPHGGDWLHLLTARGLVPAGPGEKADLVVDNIGLMHEPDQATALRERVDRLAPGGTLVLQYHSFATILEHGQWNALRHGHYAYYSTPALVGMLSSLGLSAVTAFRFPLYGGTVLLVATLGGSPDARLDRLLAEEIEAGAVDPRAASLLQRDCSATSEALATFLAAERTAGRRVAGYSAASRAVALLCRAVVGPDLLELIGDASPAKAGRRMPGSAVPIVAPAELVDAKPDSVILFVPDLLDEVRRAMPEIEANGGTWVVAEDLARAR
ncbi:class I SAM-dependent methyltransferase [Pseudonocardia yuanmonensis]|uniref:Class I SAM-dependent methyltransferase n=1 Tax=Pseudonocardia yuanmonensis TaxID=1095914 RepID=A0ABP8VUX8_9PSEU